MIAPPEAYVFALLCAGLWGLSPVVMKQGIERGGTPILATAIAVAMSFFTFFTCSTVLYGPFDSYLGASYVVIAIFLLSGAIGSALGRVMMFAGIERVGASINTAVVNTRPLFAAILGVTLLGEPISPPIAVGVLAITVGVITLSLDRQGGDVGGWHVYELGFPLAAALAYTVGNILRRYGFTTTETEILPALVFNEFAALIGILGYTMVIHGPSFVEAPRQCYGLFAVGGLLDSLGLLALFASLSLAPVVIVDPLAASSGLFAVLFSYVFLKGIERVTTGVVLGAAIVLVGVAFIAMA